MNPYDESTFHNYGDTHVLGPTGYFNGPGMLYENLTEQPAPSNFGVYTSNTPVQNGEVGYAPGLGYVVHYTDPQNMTIVNMTVDGHTLHPGITEWKAAQVCGMCLVRLTVVLIHCNLARISRLLILFSMAQAMIWLLLCVTRVMRMSYPVIVLRLPIGWIKKTALRISLLLMAQNLILAASCMVNMAWVRMIRRTAPMKVIFCPAAMAMTCYALHQRFCD